MTAPDNSIMINLDEKHLLFIEPKNKVREPEVNDEITRIAYEVFARTKPGKHCLGVHTCACGAHSDSCDFILPGGETTNSLAFHYVKFHRGEVPRDEIAKLLIIARNLGIRT